MLNNISKVNAQKALFSSQALANIATVGMMTAVSCSLAAKILATDEFTCQTGGNDGGGKADNHIDQLSSDLKKQNDKKKLRNAIVQDDKVLDNIFKGHILNAYKENGVNASKDYAKEANEYLANDSEFSKLHKPVDKNVDILSGVKPYVKYCAKIC